MNAYITVAILEHIMNSTPSRPYANGSPEDSFSNRGSGIDLVSVIALNTKSSLEHA